ncbi:MAG: aspartate/glutamate racemase family protein [Spirochaetales bacterium]
MNQKTYTIGLIRVVSFTNPELIEKHGTHLQQAFPTFRVISKCIPDQPEGIFDYESEARAVPKIVSLGKQLAAEEGVDALIVSCAADPAVAELREELPIPIIGAGSAAASLALAYTSRVGTLGITEATPLAMKKILGPYLVGELKPEGIKTTLDLMKPAGKEKVITAGKKLLAESNSRVLALACTGMSTIGIAQELEEALGIPVIDPVLASGYCAWFYVSRKRNTP